MENWCNTIHKPTCRNVKHHMMGHRNNQKSGKQVNGKEQTHDNINGRFYKEGKDGKTQETCDF
jgi:hypothetical protein